MKSTREEAIGFKAELAWHGVAINLIHNRASREACFRKGFSKGFVAGAASIDRVQVVRIALQNFFEELNWVNGYIGQADLSDAIDTYLEAMEVKENEQTKRIA